MSINIRLPLNTSEIASRTSIDETQGGISPGLLCLQDQNQDLRSKRKFFAIKMLKNQQELQKLSQSLLLAHGPETVGEEVIRNGREVLNLSEKDQERTSIDSSEMEFGDIQLSDLGNEICQGDNQRYIKEFDSRLAREDKKKEEGLFVVTSEEQEIDLSIQEELKDLPSGDFTPDHTTRKNTQLNSPASKSLASNNFDLGSSLLLNDDNDSFKDQLSNYCHSDGHKSEEPLGTQEVANQRESIKSKDSESMEQELKVKVNVEVQGSQNDQINNQSEEGTRKEKNQVIEIQDVESPEKSGNSQLVKNDNTYTQEDEDEEFPQAPTLHTTLFTELDIITECSHDDGTTSTFMTQSFGSRDLEEVSEGNSTADVIKRVYVKSIVENDLAYVSYDKNLDGQIKTLSKKETILKAIMQKLDVNGLASKVRSRERKMEKEEKRS